MHTSDCDYLTQAFFSRRKVNMNLWMKTVMLNMIVIKPLQCSFNRNKQISRKNVVIKTVQK